jgi:multisite-specific tRNA:(cytosine-C5)-methyltransferase
MLPPLFLDVQKDDLVLDMCAAPGSKTVQILEMFHKGIQDPLEFVKIKGGVVANELDSKRAWILSHQLIRLNGCGFAVVNHPAQFLPTIFQDSDDSKSQQTENGNKDNKTYFDKVLVDVPCSGDGAIRKLPMRWRVWSPLDGIHLHILQTQILIRAINLAKVGGLIVYSTCSLNPIENEAVVADVIRRGNKGSPLSLELIDIHNRFQGLKMHRGVSDWSIH